MNKKIKIIIFSLILLSTYSYRVYSINKNAPDLRNYTEEKIGQEFEAFGGKVLVNNIEVIDNKDLNKIKNLSEINKTYLDENKEKYIKIVYKAKNIDKYDFGITLNTQGYIFDDGLPSPEKIGEDKYEYIIPVENYRTIKEKDIKIFFDSFKSNELEHHYIKGVG
ncbi:hypothetical protein SDC9_124696 [bioreactor metagenome]|uniref:Uncharacterized protein n=1 Tax=bioreactor metagenome TaxID=1076179 RepID=A0A645CLD8_9ZZZZ